MQQIQVKNLISTQGLAHRKYLVTVVTTAGQES
jgi:hypothetical protein